MRKLWKRTVSLVLALCILLSVMPPVVIAQEQWPEPVTYDFRLEQTGLTYGGSSFAGASLSNRDVLSAIDDYYTDTAGTLNWNFASRDAVAMFGGGSATIAWQGIRLNGADGKYLALEIKSPGSGFYALTLNHMRASDGTEGAMYILPGDTADVPGALENATAIGSYNCYAAETTAAAAEATQLYRFEENKTYILVFRIASGSTSAKKNYLLSLDAEFVKALPEEDTVSYDFCLEWTDLTYGGSSFAGASLSNDDVLSAIDDYYADTNGTLNWNFESRDAVAMFGGGKATIPWHGIRLNGADGKYLALEIKSPGSGVYSLTLNLMCAPDGAKGAMYILPGDTADVPGALASATAIGSYNCYQAESAMASTEFTQLYAFEENETYILAFKIATDSTSAVKNYLLSLDADLIAELPEEGDTVSYDFRMEQSQLPGPSDLGFNTQRVTDSGTISAIDRYYSVMGGSALLNWKYHSHALNGGTILFGGSDGADKNHTWNGIRLNSAKDAYIAFTLRSPGEGEYALVLDYMTHKYGAGGAMYILPGSTADIPAALAQTKPVAVLDCFEEEVDKHIEASMNAGRYTFAADTEYIVVFRIVSEEEGSAEQIYISQLNMIPASQMPAPSQLEKADYDFTEVESVYAISFGESNGTLNRLYAGGTIRWKYAGKSENSHTVMMGGTKGDTVRTWSGLRFSVKPGSGWTAYRIQSPGTGNYKMTVDYQTRLNYGEVDVYILPADTADIDAAIAKAAALGSYDCYSTSDTYADASKELSRVHTFTAGEEYLVVFAMANDGKDPLYATVDGISLAITTQTNDDIPEQEDKPQPPPAQRDQVVYDFDLGHSDLTVKDDSFATKNLTLSAVTTAINGYYRTYALDWKYHSVTEGLTVSPLFGGSLGDKSYLWNGIRMHAKNSEGALVSGYYLAFTIRSPGTGKYYLTLDHMLHRYGAAAGSVYILPADTSDIAAAIAAGQALGTVSYDNRSVDNDAAAEAAQKILGVPVDCVAGEEYILVFTADQAGKQGSSHIYIEQVTLTHESIVQLPQEEEQPVQQLDKIVYDFDLGSTELTCQDKTFATRNLTHRVVADTVDSYYFNKILNWNYIGATEGVSTLAGFGGISGDSNYKWSGLRLYAKKDDKAVYDFYYAFTIQSPGSGDYRLTLDYGVHRTGAKKGSVYILPGDTTDIAAAIAAGKAIGSVNYDNGAQSSDDAAVAARSTFGNAVTLEAGKEYILVFTSDTVGRTDARLYIDSVTLTKSGIATPADIIPERVPEPEPIPSGSAVYDLDLNDPITGIYEKKTLILDVVDELNSRYTKGLSNWGWADHMTITEDDMAFISTGLTVYSNEMDWIAIRIKSPGAGLYTVGLNHATSGNGGTGAIYILPADTEDIDKAMDPANRVGKVQFKNDTGITAVTDGSRTLAGTWEFGDDKEYIVVFEAYDNAPYHDTRSYMFLSQLFLTPGDITQETEEVKTVSAVVADPGPVKLLEGTLYGTTTTVGGCDYLFMPIEGGKVLVFDLDNNILVKQLKVPYTIVRGMTTDDDGIVWMSGDSTVLYRYDPYTGVGQTIKRYKTQAADAQSGFDLIYADGCLYFGAYPTGSLMKYEIATDTYTNMGKYHDDANYVCGIVYKDGYVYAGVNGDKNGDGKQTWLVVKADAKTGKTVAMTDVTHLMPESGGVMFRGAGLAGDLLLMGGESNQTQMVAIDTDTMEIYDTGILGGINYGVSEEIDGKVYFVINGRGLFSFDVQTRTATAVPGLQDANVGMRCANHSIVEVEDALYPGINIVTYSGGNGIPRIYNLEKGITRSYYDLIDEDYGNPTDTRTVINALPGSNELYIGAYNTPNCAIYNTATGITTEFEATSSQTDSMIIYDGVLYTGNYPAGCITRVNVEDETRNQVLLSLNDETYDQARIHTLTAGDGKIFAGSTPDRYGYGGCLAWVDLDTMERHIEHNVVQDQTVNCIVYHDGYIYGTTSIYGGTGSAVRTDLSAKLFIYDVENKQKVAEFDLRDYMSGFTGNIDFISGIAADPNVDENGRFWGLVSETLFTFSYDVQTGKLTVKEEFSFGKNTYDIGGGRNWFPRPFRFDGEGNLYLAFNSNGGMRRISVENTADNERVMPITPMHYALGEDGNLYYLRGATLFVYPLNVTQEDWAQAEKVDEMILAIGKPITLESEQAVLAARQAYEALDIKHKALIQKLEILEEAESDLMELQIAALPETVALEHKELLQSLQEKYETMTEHQQKYVKNYDVLEAAITALNALLDEQAAAEVQKLIDSIKDLGDITLEHKDRIAQIRAAYDALTSYQKMHVDAALLLEAEEILAGLRAEAIERLKQLIASIGEVTLEDEETINEANEIFSWLTLEERQQVDGATLSSAKITLTKLQKAAAAEVDALIDAIGTVGRASGDAIAAARAAYDALTPGSKAYVEKLDVLEAAEEAYANLGGIGTLGIIAIVAAVLAAGGIAATLIFVPDLRKKIFKR